jgi:hypothetical protein
MAAQVSSDQTPKGAQAYDPDGLKPPLLSAVVRSQIHRHPL